MIIAVVGSGGKTTLIKKLAQQYRNVGRTVFVTTSTHMFIEPETLLTDDADTIIRTLKETGYVMAGIPEGEKIKPLPPETYDAVCSVADVVLVEADGSKRLPLKYPNAAEPVIPSNVQKIIVVWGPHGLGRPAHTVCHRLELVTACLDIAEDTVITEAHVRKLLQNGYLEPLGRRYPEADIIVYPPLA